MAALLYLGGVSSVGELSAQEAKRLRQRLQQSNEVEGNNYPTPAVQAVSEWIEQADSLKGSQAQCRKLRLSS